MYSENSPSRERIEAVWADRNEHWLSEETRGRRHQAARERSTDALILCGHGVSLRVDKGTLLIRDGFTHWPQERVEHRLFKGARDLPRQIIMLDGSGSLSFDVMTWLSEQKVPLVRLNYQGEVVSVIGGTGHAIDPEKLQWQVTTRNDPQRRLDFCCDLIRRKIEASLQTLREVVPDSRARMIALSRAESVLHRIRTGQAASVDELRTWEATAASAYFAAWQGLPLKWRSKWKYPIPSDWEAIGQRNSLGFTGRSLSNRNAKHPMNAVLNYAYGILYSQEHIEAVAQGYDPRRGIMHHEREDRETFAFVFDMVEPRRAQVDAKVLTFMLRTPLTGADFVLRTDGVCRVVPQLARRIAELVA